MGEIEEDNPPFGGSCSLVNVSTFSSVTIISAQVRLEQNRSRPEYRFVSTRLVAVELKDLAMISASGCLCFLFLHDLAYQQVIQGQR